MKKFIYGLPLLFLFIAILFYWTLPGPRNPLPTPRRFTLSASQLANPKPSQEVGVGPKPGPTAGTVSRFPDSELARLERREAVVKILDRMLDPNRPFRVRVCEALPNARDETDRNRESLTHEAILLTQEKKRSDPYLEALAGPLPFMLQLESVRTYLSAFRESIRAGDRAYPTSAKYYSLSSQAGFAVWKNRVEVDRRTDAAYLLLVFTRALRENPRLIDNPQAVQLCHKIEDRLNHPAAIDDLAGPRNEFANLLDSGGVSPEQIGYDATFRSQLKFIRTAKGIELEVPWMMELWRRTEP